jgi:hypothetical protein
MVRRIMKRINVSLNRRFELKKLRIKHPLGFYFNKLLLGVLICFTIIMLVVVVSVSSIIQSTAKSISLAMGSVLEKEPGIVYGLRC